MKNILIVFFLMLAYVSSKAQHDDGMPKPTIMIDSVQIPYSSLSQINPQSIKSLDIPKDNKYPGGVIYITLKEPNQIQDILKSKRLSLQDLADKYIDKADKGKPILYVMNSVLVTDTSDVRILSGLYHSVAVVKAKDSSYFKKAFPKAMLLMVSTQIKIK